MGYESCDIDDFTLFLKKNKIQLVADLRKNPVSRKKGFSKHKLAEQLEFRKIEYQHFPLLGTPTQWRKLAQQKKITRKKMFEDYVRIVLPSAISDLQSLRNLMKEKRVALLCYEADATDCHRLFVAEKIRQQEKRKTKIIHLHPCPKASSHVLK